MAPKREEGARCITPEPVLCLAGRIAPTVFLIGGMKAGHCIGHGAEAGAESGGSARSASILAALERWGPSRGLKRQVTSGGEPLVVLACE